MPFNKGHKTETLRQVCVPLGSIEPRAELPTDMKEKYFFGEI